MAPTAWLRRQTSSVGGCGVVHNGPLCIPAWWRAAPICGEYAYMADAGPGAFAIRDLLGASRIDYRSFARCIAGSWSQSLRVAATARCGVRANLRYAGRPYSALPGSARNPYRVPGQAARTRQFRTVRTDAYYYLLLGATHAAATSVIRVYNYRCDLARIRRWRCRRRLLPFG